VAYRYDHVDHYRVAGRQRLEDARKLMAKAKGESEADARRHLRAAAYLAGYAVECALKVYIAERAGCGRFAEACAARESSGLRPHDFAGRQGHNLALLLSATDLEGLADWVAKCRRAFMRVATEWSVDWRYCRKELGRAYTDELVGAAKQVSEWVGRQTP